MSMAALKWAREPRDLGGPTSAVLRDLADRANNAATCWPSITTIAHATGFSGRTVQRALRRLEAERLIETRRTAHGNRYLLAVQGVTESRIGGDRESHRGRQSVTQSLKKRENANAYRVHTREPSLEEFVPLEMIQAYTAKLGTGPVNGRDE